MSTRMQLPTVDCDGCGLAVLECMGDGVEAALQECGWVQIPDKAWHLCPVCRPDSPFEAVKRVRALHKVCTEIPFDEGGCEPGDCDEPVCVHDGQAWPCLTIRALENGEQ